MRRSAAYLVSGAVLALIVAAFLPTADQGVLSGPRPFYDPGFHSSDETTPSVFESVSGILNAPAHSATPTVAARDGEVSAALAATSAETLSPDPVTPPPADDDTIAESPGTRAALADLQETGYDDDLSKPQCTLPDPETQVEWLGAERPVLLNREDFAAALAQSPLVIERFRDTGGYVRLREMTSCENCVLENAPSLQCVDMIRLNRGNRRTWLSNGASFEEFHGGTTLLGANLCFGDVGVTYLVTAVGVGGTLECQVKGKDLQGFIGFADPSGLVSVRMQSRLDRLSQENERAAFPPFPGAIGVWDVTTGRRP